jgi:hypothetical protein
VRIVTPFASRFAKGKSQARETRGDISICLARKGV